MELPGKSRRTKRLTREAWLRKALQVLSREGEGKLRIASLSQELGVSKGSFYWHFEDRAEFLRALVEFWGESFTRRVQRTAKESGGDAREQLRRVLEIVSAEDLSGYDTAFDAWAAHEPEILPLVREVYAFRERYIRSLFAELGVDGDELNLRVRAFLGYLKYRPTVSSVRRLRSDSLEDALMFFTGE